MKTAFESASAILFDAIERVISAARSDGYRVGIEAAVKVAQEAVDADRTWSIPDRLLKLVGVTATIRTVTLTDEEISYLCEKLDPAYAPKSLRDKLWIDVT